jgi:hypothetical protein
METREPRYGSILRSHQSPYIYIGLVSGSFEYGNEPHSSIAGCIYTLNSSSILLQFGFALNWAAKPAKKKKRDIFIVRVSQTHRKPPPPPPKTNISVTPETSTCKSRIMPQEKIHLERKSAQRPDQLRRPLDSYSM